MMLVGLYLKDKKFYLIKGIDYASNNCIFLIDYNFNWMFF